MTRWFARAENRPDAGCLVFCLPYSGGGASVFHDWAAAFPATVEIVPVRLPGREDRIAEPVELSPPDIAAAIASRADRGYAIYGHSLGARLGFDVVRELRRLGAPAPARLYVAAAVPPDEPVHLARSVELPDEEFLTALIDGIGTPTELRDLPELRELLLPVLRADFRWLRDYRYRPEPPLTVPVVALAGAGDPEAGPATMRGWSRHTVAGFTLHTLPGDHFFPRTCLAGLAGLLAADLRPWAERPAVHR